MDDDTRDEEAEARAPKVPGALQRREFLQASVVGALSLAIPGCGADSMLASDGGARGDGAAMDAPPEALPDAGPPIEQVPAPEDVAEAAGFTMSVTSGDATPEAVILWTHHTGTAPLQLVVWEMDDDAYRRTVFVGAVDLVDGYAHADVDGLGSSTRYRFAFFETMGGERGSRSPIGRFRTPPSALAMEPLKIGAVSCVSNTRDIPTLGHAGGRDDLDVFLYLGDSTYNDGASTLDDYREKWRSNLTRPEYKTLRAATSSLSTWDDHEFDNDWNPETFGAARTAAAMRSFFEHKPVRRDATAPDRVWKVMRWGATLDVFVLDTRSERRPSTRTEPGAEYVSRAQMDWLKSELLASTAVFKIILNSVPIADYPLVFDVAARDRWEGYAAQRIEILEHIDGNAIPGVLWLAGDFHLAAAGRVATSGPGSTQHEVLAGPGAQSGNILAGSLRAPQFDWATSDDNYTVIDLDPSTARARIGWHDGTGSVLHTEEYLLA